MKATHGRGVDVVLDSLSSDLPDASWRCIADNGTFVEIGKKDMADRNNLSMEPFCRNASYRPIDMSLDSVPLSTIARYVHEILEVLDLDSMLTDEQTTFADLQLDRAGSCKAYTASHQIFLQRYR